MQSPVSYLTVCGPTLELADTVQVQVRSLQLNAVNASLLHRSSTLLCVLQFTGTVQHAKVRKHGNRFVVMFKYQLQDTVQVRSLPVQVKSGVQREALPPDTVTVKCSQCFQEATLQP